MCQEAARPVAVLLQKRALETQAVNAEKRRRAKEADREAQKDTELIAQKKAEALVRHEELKLQTLRETERAHQERAARTRQSALDKAKDKWLQTQYPSELAQKMRRQFVAANDRANLTRMLREMAAQNWFRFLPRVAELWSPQPKWLLQYGEVRAYEGRGMRVVRCAANFDCLLDEVYVRGPGEVKNPEQALYRLLHWVVPESSRYVFQSRNRCFLRFLQLNDYILDKAFVHCVICLSRWLTPANFPFGVFDWPPPVPAEVLAAVVEREPDQAPGTPPDGEGVPLLPPPLAAPPLPPLPLPPRLPAGAAASSGSRG